MNFKRFGRTANLFDKANLEGGIYLASNGNKYGSITDGVRSGVKINVLPNTQYTLSLYSNMNISIRILQWSGETYITHSPKYNVSGNVSLTITTNSTTDKIAFNVEGVNGQYAENLMLNVGETALPYQPYNDWTNTPHYIHNTSTDTITTLPAVLYPTGTTATVGLKGQTVQSSVPSPASPVMPQGTGERTGNVFDKYGNYSVGTNANNYTITGLKPNTQYTCSTNFERISGVYTASIYFGGGSSTTNGVWANSPKTQISTAEGTLLLSLRFRSDAGAPAVYNDVMAGIIWVMVAEGSTALPYEPYGYKIPISCGGTTTPVYLGEVESTRRIKKLVLTGQETSWYKSGAYQGSFYLGGVSPEPISLTEQAYCSHAEFTRISTYAKNKFCFNGSPLNLNLWIGESSWTTDDFKAYLAQQYANGTPVTVWYVLATETTGIVNEPLRKIGDYADEVSDISIPTIAGANSFDVLTTLKPSEVSLTYTGWHDASVKEWDGSQWD